MLEACICDRFGNRFCQPIYHAECKDEARLAYWRQKSKDRYRRVTREATAS